VPFQLLDKLYADRARGVKSESLYLKETPTPGPMSHLDCCAIYFTTKTLSVHYCTPFIRRI